MESQWERRRAIGNIFEDIMVENVPNLMKTTRISIIPSTKRKWRKPKHIRSKSPRATHKEKLKVARDKTHCLLRNKDRATAYCYGKLFNQEDSGATSLKNCKKNCQLRTPCAEEISFKDEGEIKTFSEIQSWKKIYQLQACPLEILKEFLQEEKNIIPNGNMTYTKESFA